MTRPRSGAHTAKLLKAVAAVKAGTETASALADVTGCEIQRARIWLNAMEAAGLVKRRPVARGYGFEWIK